MEKKNKEALKEHITCMIGLIEYDIKKTPSKANLMNAHLERLYILKERYDEE